jgi:hypothetical protein
VTRASARSGGFFTQALRFALPLFAAAAAAVSAHIAIDVAGDYVLAKDAYDALAHGSRWTVSLLALGVAFGGLSAVLRAALADARGSHGTLRSVLRAAAPASPSRFVLLVGMLAVPILLGMAGLDALAAGQPIDDLGDLVGGSFALAGTILALASSLAGFGTLAFLRLLCRYQRALVHAVEAFVRLAFAFHSTAAPLDARYTYDRPRTHSALRRCTSGNRAPPALLA